ncbi:MAG: insulinase family protein [Desulfobacterales bacterium]|nr:insulinase family protein [Desulfobacterales bacterium]
MTKAAVNGTVLDNGIRVLTKHMPHVHSVSMGVWVDVGARDESTTENGLSHLIEHMIFKGTRRRSAYDIAKEFDSIGGHTNAFTSFETTCYHAKVLDARLESMVDILSDIFLNSVFDPSEIERERPVILQEIGMSEDNPEDYLQTLASRAVWGDTPLGRSILGTRENVSTFTSQDVKHFFKRLYQPERILISAAGNLNHPKFVTLVRDGFEKIDPGNCFPERTAPPISATTGIFQRELEQEHLCINTPGIAISDPHRFAFSVLNTILGGNMSSRLFQEIREQRGLAYSVYSFASSYMDKGLFGVYAGVSPENTELTLDLILKQLDRLQTEPVGVDELADAKAFIKGNLLLAAESNDNQMVRLAQNEINFGQYIPVSEVVTRIEAVTADDVQALANQLFSDRHFSLTLLGPLKKLGPAFNGFEA